ncbi:polyphosphate kinase 2 family protein [Amnibacterium sp. CER49]|uniref:PPK2 family polyphosphate kinase n=1 Tax=Amnibacterium sp. CER49 TaxID=3039161 RepID=UPI002448C867|nr:PPK2 family polyphosphate kinase [Amnibacterium sp. CER49]MDH2442482.1 polyphosphate kinase 2 family protein [Amnibacterium sp. CER49]
MPAPLPAIADSPLNDLDPASTPGVGSRKEAERETDARGTELADLQERLYADSRVGGGRSVLLILQAMDTAGKGGIVRHVVGRLDPQGVQLHAFKAPTEEERQHDFLCRIRPHLPGPGMVAVFDRSHYEDVLVARVHGLVGEDEIERRYAAIVDFERQLVANGTVLVKVMLHISKAEQGRRLRRRLERPDKRWKYNPHDVDERARWAQYMDAYDRAIRRTATPEAPWHVVPADHKWYARWAVEVLLLDALRRIDPQWPQPDLDVLGELERVAAS